MHPNSFHWRWHNPGVRVAAVSFLIIALVTIAYAQQAPTSLDRDRAHVMLDVIKNDLKKNYYDPNYRGMDLESRFRTAEEKLKLAASLGQLFGVIAQTLDELNDSHTFFVPPGRSYRVEYGWQMQMIGDRCYVVAVKPGSDAEAKGLRPGDQLYSVDGIGPARNNMRKIQYIYHALQPRPGMRLIVIKPDGRQLQLDVLAAVQQGKRIVDLMNPTDMFTLIRESEAEGRLHRHRYLARGEDLFIWKMPRFDMSRDEVDSFVAKFRKSKALILDLRGNGGGDEETLLRLIGNIFDHDVKLGDLKRRKETKPPIAKTRGDDIFKGKLVVLIDSESASAAELFARVVQLEKRGTVIGDQSEGAVMRAMQYGHQLGLETIVPWAVSVTDADIIMADGRSLEGVGVTPDEVRLPTVADLAAGRDPILAYAVSLVGIAMSPKEASELFPIEWKK